MEELEHRTDQDVTEEKEEGNIPTAVMGDKIEGDLEK